MSNMRVVISNIFVNFVSILSSFFALLAGLFFVFPFVVRFVFLVFCSLWFLYSIECVCRAWRIQV